MAIVTKLVPGEKGRKRRHPTSVECKYVLIEDGGGKFLNLETYGSKDREMPDKLSQTLQLDEKSALALKEIIERHFGS